MLSTVADALVGRAEVLTLLPLSSGEIEGRQPRGLQRLFDRESTPRSAAARPWIERAVVGGFPEAVARSDTSRRDAWFRSYVDTVLSRDVQDLARIQALGQVPRLLQLIAARSGGLANYADLSRTTGLPQTTLKRHLALLETTFLVDRLPAWASNPGKRLVRAPKLYVSDSGVLAHLIGLDADDTVPHAARGPLLETFVLGELRKQAAGTASQLGLFHYRTHGRSEVHFVLERRDGVLVGIEVKATATVNRDDTRGLRELAEAVGERFLRGVVLYAGTEVVPLGARIHAVPVDWLWA
jgi:predicted AAA+ superfamily ATPase